MAFTDASTARRVIEGVLDAEITLAGDVSEGDPLMYNSGWKLSTNVSGKEAILIAGNTGVSGDVITAYGAAKIELTHTNALKPTMGQLIAVADTGLYDDAGSELQDIGHIVEIDDDGLHSRAIVYPAQVAIDTAGA